MLALLMSFVEDKINEPCFEQIYYNYRKRMVKMAYSILHNKDDAEDVVHETFIKIARNMDSIQDVYSQTTLSYVLKATKNTAINWNNKNANVNKEFPIDDVPELADDSFIEALDLRNDFNNVVLAIEKLEEKYKDVFFYHFIMNMKIADVADLLGRKEATIKQQLVRGKKMLKEILKDSGGDYFD